MSVLAEAKKAAQFKPPTKGEAGKAYLLVRVRGTVNITQSVKDTMRMLRVAAPNHVVVVPATDANLGMVKKVQDYVAWGIADAKIVTELLRARGRTTGNEAVTDEFVKKATDGKYAGIDAFAAALAKGEARLADLGEDFKPLFRCSPPKGGHGHIKANVHVGGPLGYHGPAIADLVRRML